MKVKLFLLFIIQTLVISVQGFASNDVADPLFVDQWALENKAFDVREDITDIKSKLRKGRMGADIGWVQLQKIIFGKSLSPVIVAVLDYGVDYEHEDLRDIIAKNNIECDDGKIPLGQAKEDRDGNGYLGDCMGIDLTARKPEEKNRPLDDVGHGTHIAGIIAASIKNGVGIAGVASHIRILPVKVLTRSEKRLAQIIDRVAEGINYAVSRGAKVINLSMGWPIGLNNEKIRQAIQNATKNGVYIVAAAGNNAHDTPVYPCAFTDVICVGATQNDGETAAFSNFGAQVDLAAPGDFILSTYPESLVPDAYSVRGYEIKSGTSQSAPYVSAAIAVLTTVFSKEKRELILARLFQGATSSENNVVQFNHGVLRIDRSVEVRTPSQLRWLFKETSTLEINENGLVNLPITIENLSATACSSTLILKSLNKNFKLHEPQLQIQLAPYERKTYIFKASVAQLASNNEWRFRLQMDSQNILGKVAIVRNLNHSQTSTALPFENSKDIKSMQSVTRLTSQIASNYFFSLGREDSGIRFYLWSKAASSFKYVGNLLLGGAKTPLGFYLVDANNDGVEDLVILALTEVNDNPTLQIFYFTTNLQPLFVQQSEFRMVDRAVFNFSKLADYRETQWFYQDVVGLGHVLLPSIIENGKIPEPDLSREEKRVQFKMRPSSEHLYYLQMLKGEQDRFELRTRVIDTTAWVESIKKSLGMRFYETINPLYKLIPSQKNINDHAVVYLFRAGQLDRSFPIEVTLSSDGIHWQKLNWPSAYSGYQSQLLLRRDQEGGNATDLNLLFGLISANRAHAVVINPEDRNFIQSEVTLDLADESENILKLQLAVMVEDLISLVIETGQSFVGFLIKNGKVIESHEQRIARTTFFGNVFTQVAIPIYSNNSRPTLYIDNTQINANNIFLWSLNERTGFSSPIRSSFALPSHCSAMNPTQPALGQGHTLNMLCRDAAGLSFNSMKFE